MNISDILRHKASTGGGEIATVAPHDSVAALVDLLAERNVGALIVVQDSRVVGIASERDVVRRLASLGTAVLGQPVSKIMTADVRCCTGDDALDEIAATMTERRIRHMPVLDGERLVGIVSIGDVVSSRIRQLEHDQHQLEQYISS